MHPTSAPTLDKQSQRWSAAGMTLGGRASSAALTCPRDTRHSSSAPRQQSPPPPRSRHRHQIRVPAP
eukprot:1835918-Rhodomonas_salina.1